jgi:hypothetical protein
MIDYPNEYRSLWGHAARGMFGIIRILRKYHEAGMTHAPTHDFVKAAMQLRELANDIEDKGEADNTFSFDFKT